jgi:hypothetical protein
MATFPANTSGVPLKIGLIGPLPPPSGGMANQTRQLARLLAEAGMAVEVVQVNAPYRPGWIERVRGLRAMFRLLPYLVHLWRCAGRVDLFHVMANSAARNAGDHQLPGRRGGKLLRHPVSLG